jgi:hypothetical protein
MSKGFKRLSNYLETKNGILTLFLILAITLIFERFFIDSSLARELLPLNTEEYVKQGLNVAPQGMSGQKMAIDVILRSLGYVKTITAGIGILMITIQGIKLIMAGGNPEEITKAKTALTYIIIAFVMISMSLEIAKIFDMSTGTILNTPANMIKHIQLFDKQVQVLITFIKYIIGAIATLNLFVAGVQMATQGGETEVITKQKARIFISIAGLVMLYLGDIAINKVFYVLDKNVYSGVSGAKPYMSASEGVRQVIGITNFVVSFLGVLCVLMLIYGAFLYALSGGNEEQTGKAKKVFLTTFIGVVLIFGAFAIVSTIISAKL